MKKCRHMHHFNVFSSSHCTIETANDTYFSFFSLHINCNAMRKYYTQIVHTKQNISSYFFINILSHKDCIRKKTDSVKRYCDIIICRFQCVQYDPFACIYFIYLIKIDT